MGCAIFSLKLIPQTVEAEITAVMPSQRACDAENQARYTLSNGPLRVQRNAFYAQSILQRVGIRQLPGDMMVSPPSARVTVNSRWHRGSFVSLVSHSSLTDCTVLSGALLFAQKAPLAERSSRARKDVRRQIPRAAFRRRSASPLPRPAGRTRRRAYPFCYPFSPSFPA